MNPTWTVLVVIVAAVAVLLGLYVNDQNNIAEKFAESVKYKKMDKKLRAVVFGATGGVGKGIVKALAESSEFEKVTLFGRRPIELPSSTENPNYLKFDQKVIDFEDPSKHKEDFQGYDVGFCALGTTSSAANYYRINHDYVVDTAKLAKEGGVKIFHFVSGGGTSKTSLFEWARVKGQTEEDITQMGFDRVTLYRPALVLTDKRENPRCIDTVMQSIDRAIDPWHFASVESDLLGKVIVQNTFQDTEEKSQILENSVINRLGKELKSKKST